MLWKLLALFVLVPMAELTLLLLLARQTSPWTALLVVLGTGVAGTLLARSQGWKTLRNIQLESSQGKIPTDSLLDAAMIFCAGALLLTPGLLTDAVGLSLLIPFFRRRYRQLLRRWIGRHFRVGSFGSTGSAERTKIIDSYIVDSSAPKEPSRRTPLDGTDHQEK